MPATNAPTALIPHASLRSVPECSVASAGVSTVRPQHRLVSISLQLAMMASLVIGCSQPPSAPPQATTSEPAKAAVKQFLEAMKRGDDQAARAMLTRVARAKCEELGMSVAPPVSPGATYAIGESEVVTDDGEVVHVATTWSDTDGDGFTSSEDVLWVVRLDPEGWRVVGMAMLIFSGEPPLLLNFEDPEDMLAKQEQVVLELQRRAKQAADAPGTATPGDGTRTARTPDATPRQ
ncbi:MAG: hypothetical protein ACO3NZ_07305 [Pirellulales bacterium]